MENQLIQNEINQNTEQSYLKYLPWILGFSLLMTLTHYIGLIILYLNPSSVPDHPKSYFITIYWALNQILFWAGIWLGIGKIFDFKKQSRLAFFLHAGIIMVETAYTYFQKSDLETHMYIYTYGFIFKLLPAFLFFLTAFPRKQFLTHIIFCIAIKSFCTTMSLSSYLVENFIGDWNRTLIGKFTENDSMKYGLRIYDVPYTFLGTLGLCFAIGSYIHYMKNYSFGWIDKFVDLRNKYSKIQAFLIFISLKLMIFNTPYFIVNNIKFSFQTIDSITDKSIVYLYSSIAFLSFSTALYFVLWAYRKFVLQYLYSKGLTPSFGYWLYLIPILGTIFFIYTLLSDNVEESNRVECFIDSASQNNRNTIAFSLIVFQILRSFLFHTNKSNDAWLIGVGISIGLLLLFLSTDKTLWISCFFIVLFFCVNLVGLSNETQYTTTVLMYSTAFMYVLVGLFYIENFDYQHHESEMNSREDFDTNILDSALV